MANELAKIFFLSYRNDVQRLLENVRQDQVKLVVYLKCQDRDEGVLKM